MTIKLVEISRLRVVRDVHIGCWMNPKTTAKKKVEFLEYMKENNNTYPKSEAILVRKAKDEKDKRKVVYHIEDGYRRYLLSKEFEFEKVYVDILDK